MNERKFKRLFELARSETPPVAAEEDFDARVLAAIRRERRKAPVSLWEQIGELFPRLAVAAVVLMAACVLTDYCSSPTQTASLTDDVNQMSEPWLYGADGGAQ